MKEINKLRFLHRFNSCIHPHLSNVEAEAGMWLS